MYLEDYLVFLVAILICMFIAIYANSKVNRSFAKYNKITTSSNVTGYDTVRSLMDKEGISNVTIGHIGGHLTDHYHPKKKIINLSDSTYNNNSISAVAVAAHEMGHVVQEHNGYIFYKIRTLLVPVINFGSGLAMPLVLIGLLIDLFALTTNPDLGFNIALVGVILYGGSFLFALITLPVELNASKRAKKMLVSNGILTSQELKGANKVLTAAALTYFASMLTSLVYFLRFLVRVLTLFGRRNNRN